MNLARIVPQGPCGVKRKATIGCGTVGASKTGRPAVGGAGGAGQNDVARKVTLCDAPLAGFRADRASGRATEDCMVNPSGRTIDLGGLPPFPGLRNLGRRALGIGVVILV